NDLQGFTSKKGEDNLKKNITDNKIGENLRFLPATPQFVGGFVNFVKIATISSEYLNDNYTYLISLVDDLTNDVVRKLSTYLLRGGISDTAYKEALYYLKEENEDKSE
ncbi:MAG: hypothetical protein RI894_2320, partial [Bacteroidota bacterium]